ncbi:MAG: S-methyl-5'-thioadenosine phosphorylase [Myxococcaceae bacterium]|nr:S-methyl-5'-thioadenosine phosphorylase [Myxococcaceae bacterium]
MLGVIGGSGIYELDGLKGARWTKVNTPFGPPSDEILVGEFAGAPVAFLPRHGRGHPIPPSELNSRANLAALKQLGCTDVLSLSAVGSLRENLPPGTFVLVDQFIDLTKGRPSSFFSRGLVGHVSLAHPTCGRLGGLVQGPKTPKAFQVGGTYLCIEGPQFSTLAESKLYRSYGADVIGMTALPEVRLAREAELCFACVAMVTDFDCWHPDHDAVTAAQVVKILQQNAATARTLLADTLPLAAKAHGPCSKGCDTALGAALMTGEAVRDRQVVEKLRGAGLRVPALPSPADPTDPHGLKPLIRTVHDWPKKGVGFRDVTTLLEDAKGLAKVIDALADRYRGQKLDAVVGVDARGFILGGALAIALGVGFVPVRKKGKLPGATLRVEYALEYGTDTVEIRAEALGEGKRVVVVDDLIATGGTATAAAQLARLRGADVVEACFIVELPDLKGRAKLEQQKIAVHALCQYEGD